VWLALSSPDHEHFHVAWSWYQSLPDGVALVFCRITQLAFLRLLTTRSVMGEGTLTQPEAWQAYDRWSQDAETELYAEPTELEQTFRSLTGTEEASPKLWADAYLAAFAQAANLTLVTFDRALAVKVKGALLLQ
jgi:hypothetical protein